VKNLSFQILHCVQNDSEDAFGQSAQTPQLFRGVECDMVIGLSYCRVPGLYWRGFDGSMIFTGESDFTYNVGHCIKISPCPACAGAGCARCGETGLQGGQGPHLRR